MSDLDRRMDRGARLGVNQGESEGPVSAEAPPWQGVRMLVAAKRNEAGSPQICPQDCPRGAAAGTDFEIWPGPMEGVGRGGFIDAVNQMGLVPRWMTPFFRVSHELPRRRKLESFLAPFLAAQVPVCVQLMGTDAELIGIAATEFVRIGAESVNLNFGCPSRQVTSGGAGGGALRHPEKLSSFCRMVKAALPEDIPLSVKLRAGWERENEMDVVLPELVSSGAVSKIFFHYRTVKELYSPLPPEIRLRRLHRAVELCGKVPLIANGDISSVAEARELVSGSGCAGVMIARPWLQDPFLLRRFYDDSVPEAEAGREAFFAELRQRALPEGALIELALMLWGRDSVQFKALIAGKRG